MRNLNTIWKPAIIMGLVLCFFMSASVQNASAQNKIGFYGGLNIANMGDDADLLGSMLANELEDATEMSWTSSKSSNSGLGVGAYYVIQTSETVGIQIEGLYVQRGVSFDLSGGGTDAEIALGLDYFEIPLLLRFSPSSQGSVHTHFVVGPVIGFNTSATLEASGAGGTASEDIDDEVESTIFGMTGGLGVTIDFGTNTAFMFDARYHLGLSNAVKDDPGDDMSITSGDFSLYAGLEFALGQ